MDSNLKRWRHDSKEQEEENSSELGGPPSLKLQKLVHLKNSDHDEYNSQDYNTPSALPLFVPGQPNSCTNFKFPRMESYFSLAQWQELELQALICRHMIAGAPVPTQLLHLVKKSLIASNPPLPFYLSHQHFYPHYQPALVQTGYWGRGAMDPEPGRCRRTDGKKWRCSRDVVTGQKYCERHVNRGRNRSRKPVETATTGESIANAAATAATTTQGMGSNGGIPHFTLSGLSPSMDLLHLSRRPSDSITETTGPFKAHNETRTSGARTLRHFFSDWPR